MDIFVARQPIFDRRMNLYGYELLHRQSRNNFYEGTDDTIATASLISNSFLVIGFNELIEGTRGFINFSEEFLQQEIPRLLPKDKVVVEILERVEATDEVVNACRKIKSNGYILALDDFAVTQSTGGCAPLIDLADIIKIDVSVTDLADQVKLIDRYRGKIAFLAEKVETRQEYEQAKRVGYDLFQGYFFSKPLLINRTDIISPDGNLVQIFQELQKDEPDYTSISKVIERDLGLSYKLFRMANSVYYGSKHRITSIRQAITFLGTQEMQQWVQILMLNINKNIENAELVKTSMIRGRLLSLIAKEIGQQRRASDYFIVGIFSSIDIILNRSMGDLLSEMLLLPEVDAALKGHENELRVALDAVLSYERTQWDIVNRFIESVDISQERFGGLYMEALKWQQSLPNQ